MNQKKSQYQHVEHEFGPVYNRDSHVLILGSFPSVKSREQQFYYGHPQNRFWKMLAAVYQEELPVTIEEKKAFLLRNHIALWDVISSCDIIGSSDSSIKNVVVNDVGGIIKSAKIRRICCNGEKAYRLCLKYMTEQIPDMEICKMPSTSPANASCSLEQLVGQWAEVLSKPKRKV